MGRNLYMTNYFEYQPHYFVFYQPRPPKLLIIKRLKIVLTKFVLKMGLGVLYLYSLLLKSCSLTSECYPVKVEDNNQFVNKIVYCTSLHSSRLPSVVIGDGLSRCKILPTCLLNFKYRSPLFSNFYLCTFEPIRKLGFGKFRSSSQEFYSLLY